MKLFNSRKTPRVVSEKNATKILYMAIMCKNTYVYYTVIENLEVDEL